MFSIKSDRVVVLEVIKPVQSSRAVLSSHSFGIIRMKTVILLCLFGLATVAYARPNETYSSKYDSIDLDEIFNNRRLLIPYINCMLDKGKCTPEGKELKSHIKEGLEEDCAKCTPKQQDGTRRVLSHLINHEPDYWKQLKAKYDSSGKYAAAHEAELKELKA